jgi:ABC-type Zn2+ transport system substrate-binding protein/surface adhesin
MKSLLTFAAVLFFAALPAYSADGRIPDSSLARLGLAGMTSMSDAQGLEIRGLGVMDAMGGDDGYGNKENGHKDHHKKEHKQHEHEHKQHEKCDHFKCDVHVKPSCNFSSLCHTHAGKAG